MGFVKPQISSILGAIDANIRLADKNAPPRGHQRYHPSAFGSCLRQMQYQRYEQRGYLTTPKPDKDGKLLRVFGQGHTMHQRWVKYASDMGILRGYWNCSNQLCGAFDDSGVLDQNEVSKCLVGKGKKPRVYGKDNIIGCFRPDVCKCGCNRFHYDEIDIVSKQLNFYGHCDMVFDFSRIDPAKYQGIKRTFDFGDLPKNPIVIDMKTINDFGYSKLLKSGPSMKYMIQLTIYANILPVDYGVLIYQNKNTAQTAVYQIQKNTDTIYQKIKQQAKKMNDMVDRKELPPPRYQKDSYDCDGCDYKDICHKSKIWQDPKLQEKQKSFYGNLM